MYFHKKLHKISHFHDFEFVFYYFSLSLAITQLSVKKYGITTIEREKSCTYILHASQKSVIYILYIIKKNKSIFRTESKKVFSGQSYVESN